jgi:DNA replication initiation complex subunit (GINS family)
MARDIDKKKTQKALRKLRRAKARAESNEDLELTDWEKEFFEEVEERLEKFGSAFADPEKGHLDEALSLKQAHIVKEIDKKSRKPKSGMKRSSFSNKKKSYTSNTRDINEDNPPETSSSPPASSEPPDLKIVSGKDIPQPQDPSAPPTPRPPRGQFKPRIVK